VTLFEAQEGVSQIDRQKAFAVGRDLDEAKSPMVA
jgi:hypothetical protein